MSRHFIQRRITHCECDILTRMHNNNVRRCAFKVSSKRVCRRTRVGMRIKVCLDVVRRVYTYWRPNKPSAAPRINARVNKRAGKKPFAAKSSPHARRPPAESAKCLPSGGAGARGCEGAERDFFASGW